MLIKGGRLVSVDTQSILETDINQIVKGLMRVE